jgi:hypothetical protein
MGDQNVVSCSSHIQDTRIQDACTHIAHGVYSHLTGLPGERKAVCGANNNKTANPAVSKVKLDAKTRRYVSATQAAMDDDRREYLYSGL